MLDRKPTASYTHSDRRYSFKSVLSLLCLALSMTSNTLKHSQTGQRLSTRGNHQVIRTTTAQIRIINPSRFPIKQSLTTTDRSNDRRNIFNPRRLTSGRERDRRRAARKRVRRIRARSRPIRFYDHERLAPRRCHIRQTRFEARESSAAAVEWVVGHAHDVEIGGQERPFGKNGRVEIFLRAPIPTVVEVDEDLRLRCEIGVFDACGCGM